MKKLLLCLLACLLLCGCTQTDSNADTDNNTDTDTTVSDTAVDTFEEVDGAPVIYFARDVSDTAVKLYGAQGLPPLCESVEGFKLSYEDGEFYVGEGVLYTDNGRITVDGTSEVTFEFGIYQDSLPYTEPLLNILNGCVTVDYEENTFDRLDTAKDHITLTVNGEPAELAEVRLGKGNGHVDYSFTATVGDGFPLDTLKTFEIVID